MLSYQYYAVSYVPDIHRDKGVVLCVVAISRDAPTFFAEKRLTNWTPVQEMDPDADCALLTKMLDDLCGRIALNPAFAREASGWENSLRVAPGGDFRTSDFEGTFSRIAQAELGFVH